jgi:hypothetical protein
MGSSYIVVFASCWLDALSASQICATYLFTNRFAMISSPRCQNAILVTTIVITIVSAGFIVGTAQYYGGTFVLINRLETSLSEIQLSDVDPSNSSVYPTITLIFNLKIPTQAEGNVRIPFFGATLWLNNDILSYAEFAYRPPLAEQYLHSDYDRNVTLIETANVIDRQTILDAYSSSTWNWNITLRYYILVFDDPNSISWNWFYFYTTNFTLI